jgi:4-hydroxybenzoate polyprenyltransferase
MTEPRRRPGVLLDLMDLMTAHLRVVWLLLRPPLLILLGLFAMLGTAVGGRPGDPAPLLLSLLVVTGFLLAAVAVNDLSDEAVDRVNLPDDPRRPLVSGAANRRQMWATAGLGALLALAAAAVVGPGCVLLLAGGLALAAAYSLPPLRLAKRGALAALLLPVGYVTVPFGAGLLAAGAVPGPRELALLGALYLGFIGRILLKDFRDVRGDTLLGKRTFLVRHGRVATCALSAALWSAGSLVLLTVPGAGPVFIAGYAVQLAAGLLLLHRLAGSRDPRRDERLIAAVAILGRGLVLTLLTLVSARQTGVPAGRTDLLIAMLTLAVLAGARHLARYGRPGHRLRLPVPAARPQVVAPRR